MRMFDLDDFINRRCYIRYDQSEEYDWLMDHLDEKNIRWVDGSRPRKFRPTNKYPYLEFNRALRGLYCTNKDFMDDRPIASPAQFDLKKVNFDDVDAILNNI